MSIYIVTHKPYDFPKSEDYLPIQVGGIFDDKLLSDSTLNNISHKNKNYCELTALYWLWKNANDEFIGLVHYRRYLLSLTTKNLVFNDYNIATEAELKNQLSNSDIVLPKIHNLRRPVFINWGIKHFIKDWIGVGEIINKIYPDYMDSFIKVSEENYSYFTNMLYCDKETLNKYCEWLFTVLFEYEKQINIDKYDPFQQRLYGFLSERLLTVWIDKNNLTVAEFELIQIDQNTLSTDENIFQSLSRKISKEVKRTYRVIEAKILFHYFKKRVNK